jgi:hypothetical protein
VNHWVFTFGINLHLKVQMKVAPKQLSFFSVNGGDATDAVSDSRKGRNFEHEIRHILKVRGFSTRWMSTPGMNCGTNRSEVYPHCQFQQRGQGPNRAMVW